MEPSSMNGKGQAALRRYQAKDIVADRYEVVSFVAEGGMSEVYLVLDIKLMRQKRAMKVAKQPIHFANIQPFKEAQLLMELRHQHLPILYDVDEQAGIIIMEWVEGCTLHELMQQHKLNLQAADIIAITRQLCAALNYLHRHPRKIIHKDLKPANIMLTPQGIVKLIDFGISKFDIQQAMQTVSFGTPGFAAPEQLQGKPSNEQSDIYSFGAIVYYLLTEGKRIFQYEQAHNPEHSIRTLLPYSSPALTQLLIGCLQYDPKLRFQSTSELSALLAVIEKGEIADVGTSGAGGGGTLSGLSAYRIAFLSLAPEAGATTMAIAAAEMFAQLGQEVSLVEYIHERGASFDELPWLRQREALKDAAAAIHGYRQMKTDRINWAIRDINCLEPPDTIERSFMSLLNAQRANIVCVDCSSYWEVADLKKWLGSCQLIVLVADPTSMIRNRHSMQKIQQLLLLIDQLKLKQFWVANKDMPFSGRKEWLRLMGTDPLIMIPQLPTAEMYRLLWNGKRLIQHRKFKQLIQKKLMPLIKTVRK